MIRSTNKLWVNLLSKKYSAGPNTLDAIVNSSSPSWSSIVRAKNVLKTGYMWRVGAGNSSFWFSNWSSYGFLGSMVPIIDIHDLHLTVKDVFTSGEQHTDVLYTNLPQHIADSINNSHIRFNPTIEDAFIWNQNKNGIYTTKNGYSWLLSVTPYFY